MQLPFSRSSISPPFPRHIHHHAKEAFGRQCLSQASVHPSVCLYSHPERSTYLRTVRMRIRYKTDQLHDPEKLHHSYTRSRHRDKCMSTSSTIQLLPDQSKASTMSCGIQTSATSKITAIKELITAKEEQIVEHHKNIEALQAEIKTLRDEEKAEEEIRTEKKHKLMAWLEDVRPPSICGRIF